MNIDLRVKKPGLVDNSFFTVTIYSMLTDAHCHPFDREQLTGNSEQGIGVLAAASACSQEEFTFNEELAHNAAAPTQLLLCFGVHPQLPAVRIADGGGFSALELEGSLGFLNALASAGRLSAVGECGFDLFNTAYRETEYLQDRIFSAHVEISLRYDLPMVLHVRRAVHKIFALTKTLRKCRALIFHSWQGTLEDAKSILNHGVNAYFSFGNTIMLNHKKAVKCCALLPAERILTETDAPYQPRRGEKYSGWADLPFIIETAAALRNVPVNELEQQVEVNFKNAFLFK